MQVTVSKAKQNEYILIQNWVNEGFFVNILENSNKNVNMIYLFIKPLLNYFCQCIKAIVMNIYVLLIFAATVQ